MDLLGGGQGRCLEHTGLGGSSGGRGGGGGEGTPLLWRAGCGCLGACMFSEHPTPRSVDVVGGLCVFYKN